MRRKQEITPEQMISDLELQLHFCDNLMRIFENFRENGKTFQTSLSDSVKLSVDGGKAVGVTLHEAERHALVSGKLTELNKLYDKQGEAAKKIGGVNHTLDLGEGRMFGFNEKDKFKSAQITVSGRLGPQAIAEQYFLADAVLAKLNYRQRILLCDIIFDQAQTFYNGVEKYKPKDVQFQTTTELVAARKALGAIFSECLQQAPLGMKNADDFEPHKDFRAALAAKRQAAQAMMLILGELTKKMENAEAAGNKAEAKEVKNIMQSLVKIINKSPDAAAQLEEVAKFLRVKAGELSSQEFKKLKDTVTSMHRAIIKDSHDVIDSPVPERRAVTEPVANTHKPAKPVSRTNSTGFFHHPVTPRQQETLRLQAELKKTSEAITAGEKLLNDPNYKGDKVALDAELTKLQDKMMKQMKELAPRVHEEAERNKKKM